NLKYEQYLYETQASVVIVSEGFIPEKEIARTLIYVADAHKAFVRLLEYHNQMRNQKSGIEPNAQIHDSAVLGENVYVGGFSYVSENAKIGNNVIIYPNSFIGEGVSVGDGSVIYSGVQLCSETQIGANCTIHSNTVIGADGFGFSPKADGTFEKVPQIGNVIIE